MKAELAMRLIADQMQWRDDDATATEEFAWLKLMADYKYDHYQGFQAGARFYVALVGWLSQFKTVDERRTAYQFLKENLIFVSQREMHHLVSLLMPAVDRTVRNEVAHEMLLPLYKTWTDTEASRRVRLRIRRTLFIALSDGARIDVFRRYNEGVVSNEQVLASSEISKDKWKDLLDNLAKLLRETENLNEDEAFFERICLIDDFTGSGSSLIRFDEESGKWKGKVQRFCKLYGKWHCAKAGTPWKIHIHHHLASAKACAQIEEDLQKFGMTEPRFTFSTTYSYKLPQNIVISDLSDPTLVALIRKYYDPEIEDEHTKKDIWFGYRKSGLPLVLDHNTPNNSVALLWAESPADSPNPPMNPLFVRRKRHSSYG